MKITIEDQNGTTVFEIPKWAHERRLTLLAGVELLATKVPWDSFWEVKKERCNRCGQCCMTHPPNSERATPYGTDDEGKCKALFLDQGDIYTCDSIARFLSCLKDPIDEPECSIIKEKVEAR